MKYLSVLTPLLFIFLSTSAEAKDYYYCDCQAGASTKCAAGKNSNDGLSKLSPRKTFENANTTFNSFFAGDSIQFCRGGSFTANAKHRWVNFNCTSSNTCSVTAYDTPNNTSPPLSSPIITQQSNNSLFALEDGGNADPDGGYNFSNLDLRCTGCLRDGAAYGFFLFNDVNYVSINNISIDFFKIGIHLAGSNAPTAGSNGKHDFITLNKLIVKNNIGQGILGGANNLTISNSYFENNGEGTILGHNLYLSRGDNIIIRNNELYRSSLDSNKNCNSVSLVVHGTISNLLIEKNLIKEEIGKANQTCWGISVDPAFSKPESFMNITIRGNTIINVGNLGIGLASCDTCVIENNVIIQKQAYKFTAISAPVRTRKTDDLMLTKITVRNNSIYTTSKGTGIVVGTEGTQHVVVNNAIHYSGTEKFSCFNLGLATSNYTAVDNNACYYPNALATSEWEFESGTSPNPLAAWQTKSSFGSNSKNINPEFKNTNLPFIDLSAQSASSPISNSGHSTLAASIDYRGKTRDAKPDIGAIEYGTFNPPAKTKAYVTP